MFCPNCGNTLSDNATICSRCGKQLRLSSSSSTFPQQILSSFSQEPVLESKDADAPLLSLPQTPLQAEGPEGTGDRAIEDLWHELMVQRERHQELLEKQHVSQQELTHLRDEIARLSPLENETPQTVRRVGISSIILLLFFFLAFSGFSWFLYELVNARADLRFDNISVLGTTLTVIGSFYLAYDLLGRQYGPLQWISLFVTSGLLGGIVAEPFVLILTSIHSINDAVTFLLASVVQGGFAGILFSLDIGKGTSIFSLSKGFIGIVFSTLYWGILLSVFVPADVIESPIIAFGLALFLGVPSGLLIGGFHRFFRGKQAKERPKVFSLILFLKALLVFTPIWGLFVTAIILQGGQSWSDNAGLIIVFGILLLSGVIPGGFARYVFWTVNHLPERVLGAAGFILTIIGTLLPVIQPLSTIFAATPK
jgi:hypothetical protein